MEPLSPPSIPPPKRALQDEIVPQRHTALIGMRDLLLAGRAWVFLNVQANPYLDVERARVIGTFLVADFIEAAVDAANGTGGEAA